MTAGVRALAITLAAWALAACSGDVTTPVPSSGSALFVLVAVDAVPLPALIDSTGEASPAWLTDGVLLLQGDGRCRILVRADSTRDVSPRQSYRWLWDIARNYTLSDRLLRMGSPFDGDTLYGSLSAQNLAEARRASLALPLTSPFPLRLEFTREWDASAAAERIWRLDNPGFAWGAVIDTRRLPAAPPGR